MCRLSAWRNALVTTTSPAAVKPLTLVGIAGRKLQGGNAPGAAAAEGRDPDVVLGHERDQIAVNVRESEVAR